MFSKIFKHIFSVRPIYGLQGSRSDYLQHKQQALDLVRSKVEYWNRFYQFDYNTVRVKNTASRWGSCSSKGNLNFHYKILFLPPKAQDYLIVHELCHLKEMNHSRRFWDLVAKTIPDYKEVKEILQ